MSSAGLGGLNLIPDPKSADIVMYDVPPPSDGVRGIDAYRDTWPPFFSWQEAGDEHHSFPDKT